MRQDWHHLLFAHWSFSPDEIRPLVPARLELDTFEGRAWVGLVPFTMSGVRPTFFPVGARFHEVNLRTYVRGEGTGGVWFFSLDAASRLAVLGARASFGLPYFFARMRMRVDASGRVHYESRRRWPGPTPAGCRLQYEPTGPAAHAKEGTLEHFLIERYVLFSRIGERFFRARVKHAPYEIQPASASGLDESLFAAAGLRRPGEPPLLHYAREVRVRVFGPEPLG